MSRSVSATMVSAIDSNVLYQNIIRATAEKSRIFFSAVTSSFPYGGAEGAGLFDDPTPQSVGYNSDDDTAATFYNDSGTLKYMTQGNLTPVDTSLPIQGNPSVVGDYLYRINGVGDIIRHEISWALITARITNPFLGLATTIGTPSETALAVHGVSPTRCVVVMDGDGGFRMGLWNNTTEYLQTYRFMFPKMIDYTDGGSERTMAELALFSAALEIGGVVYAYISDNYKGSVLAASWDEDTLIWGDIFTAVPTDLQNSLCEFRVANAYARNGTAYLVGQYHRTENIETDRVYSLILSSPDGRSFAIDRFCLVSDLGFRFHAVGGTDKLFLSHCNRVCFDDITYVFDGSSGSNGQSVSIPSTSFKSFRDSDLSRGQLDLKAGNEALTWDSQIVEESKLILELGYRTTAGDEYVTYATYIIESVFRGFADGVRTLRLDLVGESEWKLEGLSSPFYTEIFSKSSAYVTLIEEETGQLYLASGIKRTEARLTVDFWSHEEHTDGGITGILVGDSGGVNFYQAGASHDLGIRTKDLKTVLGLNEYPKMVATSITAHLYGWSHNANGGSTNDTVELILITRDPDTKVETINYSSGSGGWPNTWPNSVAGDDPVVTTIGGLTIGHEVVKVGMRLTCTEETWFCVERIEVISGMWAFHPVTDGNTGWEFEAGVGYKVPKKGRPFIMFGQKPFDAWNFKVAAAFTNTIAPPHASYSVAVGLVGLAEDGANYILGRWNKSNGKVEIIKTRDGADTLLASVTPSIVPADTYAPLMFEHHDGTINIYVLYSKTWSLELTYDWTAADSWMFTSQTITKKVGIYGNIDVPKFRTTGLNLSPDPEAITADGVPMLPGESITDFPTSGEVEIGDAVYSYASKIDPPSPVRGPYQFRQNDLYYPPFGDGYGLDMRYFNWTAAAGIYTVKLVALDDGHNFLIKNSEFQVQQSTGGVLEYLRNRSRHFADNPAIGTVKHSLVNRVYITGGLATVALVDGEPARAAHRTWCYLRTEGDLTCTYFEGSNGDLDATVEDLIERISIFSGGRAVFPGDILVASQAISGDYQVGIIDFTDGFDLRFEVASNATVDVKTNIAITESPLSDIGTTLRIENTGGDNFKVSLIETPSGIVWQAHAFTLTSNSHKFRVLYHDNFATLYMDDRWAYTFHVSGFTYGVNVTVTLNGTFTATNIRLTDLHDWREAVYIDLETDGVSAISNIIQERPVEVINQPDGSIAYWYDPARDTVTSIIMPKSHEWTQRPPKDGASDAIIYTADEVKCLQLSDFAQTLGFATRVYRFPNLDVGAFRAARIMLQRLFEKAKPHTVRMRPDARLVPGDILALNYNVSGTGTAIAKNIITENVGLQFTPEAVSMNVQGREQS